MRRVLSALIAFSAIAVLPQPSYAVILVRCTYAPIPCKEGKELDQLLAEMKGIHDDLAWGRGRQFSEECSAWRRDPAMNREKIVEIGETETLLANQVVRFRQLRSQVHDKLRRLKSHENPNCAEAARQNDSCINDQSEAVDRFDSRVCSSYAG